MRLAAEGAELLLFRLEAVNLRPHPAHPQDPVTIVRLRPSAPDCVVSKVRRQEDAAAANQRPGYQNLERGRFGSLIARKRQPERTQRTTKPGKCRTSLGKTTLRRGLTGAHVVGTPKHILAARELIGRRRLLRCPDGLHDGRFAINRIFALEDCGSRSAQTRQKRHSAASFGLGDFPDGDHARSGEIIGCPLNCVVNKSHSPPSRSNLGLGQTALDADLVMIGLG